MLKWNVKCFGVKFVKLMCGVVCGFGVCGVLGCSVWVRVSYVLVFSLVMLMVVFMLFCGMLGIWWMFIVLCIVCSGWLCVVLSR